MLKWLNENNWASVSKWVMSGFDLNEKIDPKGQCHEKKGQLRPCLVRIDPIRGPKLGCTLIFPIVFYCFPFYSPPPPYTHINQFPIHWYFWQSARVNYCMCVQAWQSACGQYAALAVSILMNYVSVWPYCNNQYINYCIAFHGRWRQLACSLC